MRFVHNIRWNGKYSLWRDFKLLMWLNAEAIEEKRTYCIRFVNDIIFLSYSSKEINKTLEVLDSEITR